MSASTLTRSDEVAYLAATQATANDHGFWGNGRSSRGYDNGSRVLPFDDLTALAMANAEHTLALREPPRHGPELDLSSLTSRQLAVAQGLSAGLTREEIARMVGCAISTVDYAVHGIRRKLEAA